MDGSSKATPNRWQAVQAVDVIDPHDPRVNQEVSLELVWLHARMLQRMPIIQSFLVLGFWLIISSSVAAKQFIAWAALTLSVECLRAYFGARALRLKKITDARQAHFIFVVLAALAGGAIAVAAVLFLPECSVFQRASVGFLLTGIPAAGVAVSQSSKYIIGSYALAILLPSGYTWGLIRSEERRVGKECA